MGGVQMGTRAAGAAEKKKCGSAEVGLFPWCCRHSSRNWWCAAFSLMQSSSYKVFRVKLPRTGPTPVHSAHEKLCFFLFINRQTNLGLLKSGVLGCTTFSILPAASHLCL